MENKKKKLLYILLLRVIIPGIITCIIFTWGKQLPNSFLVFRYIILSLMFTIPALLALTVGTLLIQTFVDLASEGIVGIIGFFVIFGLLSLRLMNYGEDGEIMSWILKLYAISSIIYFIEVKLLKIDYHKL